MSIHCIVIAHGANEACKNFSKDNIYGSLAITYSDIAPKELNFPFMIHLDKNDLVHVFDSHNLEIILNELDTFYDFNNYITAKEDAIDKYDGLVYCGEEDLLAHYFLNFDDSKNQHFIGVKEKNINGLAIPEGEWLNFINSSPYKRKRSVDKISYFWDKLLDKTCDNALKGTLMGDVKNVFEGQSAIQEMAKEPRFMMREFSKRMIQAIKNYPPDREKFTRNVTLMGSFYKNTAYVFLQIHNPKIIDYEKDYRPKRRTMLEIACGAAKNKYPQFSKIVGIAIDAPKHNIRNSEDFALFKCEKWSKNDRSYYENLNKDLRFFESKNLNIKNMHPREFPSKLF